MKRKKYFKTKKEAIEALNLYDPHRFYGLNIFKMPKGSKKVGWYALCTHIEYLNTY